GMRRSPGFTVVTVLTLALGIALCSVWFGILNNFLLQPLPGVPQADRLFTMQAQVTYPDFETYRDGSGVGAAAAFLGPVPVNVASAGPGGGEPQRIFGHLVSAEYFPTLGLHPLLGRFFDAAQEKPGGAPVVVVSERFWRTHLESSRGAIGGALAINGRRATIIGVAPRDFFGVFPSTAADIFLPLTADPTVAPELADDLLHRTTQPAIRVLLRLKPGITAAGAAARLDAQAQEIQQQRDPAHKSKGRLVRLMQAGNLIPVPPEATTMLVIFYSLLIVLILSLTCANLAGLILARGSARAREIAIRLSVGASRARLVRQLLTESVALAVVGGLAGFATTHLFFRMIALLRPGSAPTAFEVNVIEPRVMLFAFAISALAGIGFGLMPALAVTRPDLVTMLKAGFQAKLGRYGRFSLRNFFVVYQVAAAMTLMLIMGFVLVGMQYGAKRDPGFDPAPVSLFSLDPARDGLSPEQSVAAFTRLPERLAQIGAVDRVSLSAQPPLVEALPNTSISVRPAGGGESETVHTVVLQSVGPGFFGALGTTILRGTEFLDSTLRADPAPSAILPAVLNQTAAQELFAGGDPLGRRIRQDQRLFQVIGVARYDRPAALMNRPVPMIFLPLSPKDLRRASAQGISVALHLRAPLDIAAVKKQLRAIDPRLSLFEARTLPAYLEEQDRLNRIATAFYLPIGLFGLVLACLGLAGVTAQTVEGRRKEIGIRMALGARREQLLRLVMREGVVMVVIGAACGFAGAFVISRILGALWAPLAQLLASSAATGPSLVLGVPLVLISLAAIACYLPARRSSTIDPLIALREE
ncbi:MAG TPA: ABC transporter permease, partial [Bryobacteraceae bacterium]|nr:ABC transporter permease [Bryobacteraceae bacterium]